jgi:hypothetical protein
MQNLGSMTRIILVGVQAELHQLLQKKCGGLMQITASPDVRSALANIYQQEPDLIVIDDSATLFEEMKTDESSQEGFRLGHLLAKTATSPKIVILTDRKPANVIATPSFLAKSANPEEQAESLFLLLNSKAPISFSEVVLIDKEGEVVDSAGSPDPEMRADVLEFLQLKGMEIGKTLGVKGPGQFLSHQPTRTILCNLDQDLLAFGLVNRQQTDVTLPSTQSSFDIYLSI